MAVEKKGNWYYGDSWDDLDFVLEDYAKANKYTINTLEKITCNKCSSTNFVMYSDEESATCKLRCKDCENVIYIESSKKYMDENNISYYECLCGNNSFHVTIGKSFYSESDDVRWVYVGGYCSKCGLLGNYIDWNER